MDESRVLRAVRIDRIQFAHDLLVANMGNKFGSDTQPVAFHATQGNFQIVCLRKTIFKESQRAATHLTNEQVESTRFADIERHHGSAVGISIGAGQVADFQKAPAFDIHVRPIAFEGTEIVFPKNVPGTAVPELAEFFIQLAGQGNIALFIARP